MDTNTIRQPAGSIPHAVATRPGNRPLSLSRLRYGIGRQLLAFGAIGIVSTAAFALLYLVLRPLTGAIAANAAALIVTAIGNTAANRRLTFGVRSADRASVLRDQFAGLAALGVALSITTVAVSILATFAPAAGHLAELAVLVAANGAATVARFVLLRAVITHSPRIESSVVPAIVRSQP